ncbi:hypothetical protein MRB53_011916 [Persea americana]|uniref:Uncharacterized protein n=1 Tax=Persea americana TaxID=3435 RepID=A0ACC2LX92_PERAE|nr:hypothetical protein MRB53_011916 [Persea americana]
MSGRDWVQGGPSSSTMGTIEGPVPRRMITALIVDDDGVNRRIHNLVLRSLGVESREVNNGKEAVDLCMAGANFDLIIMAMEIPVFDGPKATRLLRAIGVSTMIVGVSASQGPEIVDFMNAGIDAFYMKPITRTELIPILEDVIKYKMY